MCGYFWANLAGQPRQTSNPCHCNNTTLLAGMEVFYTDFMPLFWAIRLIKQQTPRTWNSSPRNLLLEEGTMGPSASQRRSSSPKKRCYRHYQLLKQRADNNRQDNMIPRTAQARIAFAIYLNLSFIPDHDDMGSLNIIIFPLPSAVTLKSLLALCLFLITCLINWPTGVRILSLGD